MTPDGGHDEHARWRRAPRATVRVLLRSVGAACWRDGTTLTSMSSLGGPGANLFTRADCRARLVGPGGDQEVTPRQSSRSFRSRSNGDHYVAVSAVKQKRCLGGGRLPVWPEQLGDRRGPGQGHSHHLCLACPDPNRGGVVTLDLSRGHRPVASAVAPLDLSVAQETRKKRTHRRLGVHRARHPLAL